MKDSQKITPNKAFGGTRVPTWLLETKGLSAGAKLCYASLSRSFRDAAVDSGIPVDPAVANEYGVTEGQHRGYIQELVTYGLIEFVADNIVFLSHPDMSARSG